MKKGMVRTGIILAVLLIVYLLISFMVPFYRGGTFWASFVFTLVSLCIAVAAAYIGFIKQSDVKSKFYCFPIVKIGAIYALVQLIAGLIFMIVGKWVPVWISVLLYAAGLGVAVIGLISAETVTDEIREQDDKLKINIATMRALQSKVNQLPSMCEDSDTLKLLHDFSEKI